MCSDFKPRPHHPLINSTEFATNLFEKVNRPRPINSILK